MGSDQFATTMNPITIDNQNRAVRVQFTCKDTEMLIPCVAADLIDAMSIAASCCRHGREIYLTDILTMGVDMTDSR